MRTCKGCGKHKLDESFYCNESTFCKVCIQSDVSAIKWKRIDPKLELFNFESESFEQIRFEFGEGDAPASKKRGTPLS